MLEHGGQDYDGTIRNMSSTGALVEGLWNVPSGTRFQVLAPVVRATWHEVAELDDTQRGTGGFGSTGTRYVQNSRDHRNGRTPGVSTSTPSGTSAWRLAEASSESPPAPATSDRSHRTSRRSDAASRCSVASTA